uniref:Uncharacterized protein n=1 Tax=Streptomyces sp. NBC_00003 TaxID=2903608 RepID=A0AAU2V882_9ACTN
MDTAKRRSCRHRQQHLIDQRGRREIWLCLGCHRHIVKVVPWRQLGMFEAYERTAVR